MKKVPVTIIAVWVQAVVFGQLPNWQHLDLAKDSVFGVSTEKAYAELLNKKKPVPVIVAVIDSGVDVEHEDLRNNRWKNQAEVPNGKDDDHNGYVDDEYGWNFIGSRGGNVVYDNFELTRLVRKDKQLFDSLFFTGVPAEYRQQYSTYRALKENFDRQRDQTKQVVAEIAEFKRALAEVLQKMGTTRPALADFQQFQPAGPLEEKVRKAFLYFMEKDPDFEQVNKQQVEGLYRQYKDRLDYHLNLDFDPRRLVGDDPDNTQQRHYGNNDVKGPDGSHGTHVAGIIGAIRNNGQGMDGIADFVRILPIRVTPNGDERDKDVANAIYYAVDNGAAIINMSFGKPYSPGKKVVDEAVKYAAAKNVLMVHGAGNDSRDLDLADNGFYPNKFYADSSGEAPNWITVGATHWRDGEQLVAPFSNYGKQAVDVFAPGVRIYSTLPGDQYGFQDGTSMAAPVVTGIAALLKGYYPQLSAVEIKAIILQSVTKVNHPVVLVIGGFPLRRLPFAEICVAGGIVNAYNALKMAATYPRKDTIR